jgi:hypothetical protein
LPSSMRNMPDGCLSTSQSIVISKTNNRFTKNAIDQDNEQENRNVKGSGGCIGLTDNPIAFRRCMLSGPELSRLQTQLEREYLLDDDTENPTNLKKHEQCLAAQNNFQRLVDSLSNSIRKMGNTFLDNVPGLVTLDSRRCISRHRIAHSGRHRQDKVPGLCHTCAGRSYASHQ